MISWSNISSSKIISSSISSTISIISSRSSRSISSSRSIISSTASSGSAMRLDWHSANASLYDHIQPASRLIDGPDYAVFKEGVTPMWEDPANLVGGRWLIFLTKQQRDLDLDVLCLETLLMLVGEAFTPYGEEVCGAVVSVRGKEDRIALWTSNADSSQAVITIGGMYKRRLGLPAHTLIAYQAHGGSMAKSGQPWADRERAGGGETAAPAGGDTGW
ncbi:eukaryotic translation initiation factor 4E-like [Lethenteron reissneri]|uniref:eukaryotic translation initiation factor 4E-like n=1 Tax=Lethenteron reissneri TaxID=7753 RepID=UPI002AB795FE|nr:eukaryotic translation initiation factor 4E-like [Lethenteron reissneri]XP_061437672.1 eukaryotic translation initiation factor 4E-like [Lethenteron reissneri]